MAYLPTLRAGFIWDDDFYVTQNGALRTSGGLADIWFKLDSTPQYYPLVFTTFWAEYHLWKLWPVGYHLVNVILHGLGAVLLWFVLRRLAIPGAWLAAAVFAVHPVEVESVAWVTERKNVLSGVFYFSAMLAYLGFCRVESGVAPVARRWSLYRLAAALFLCALFSKTVTCTLPAVILLLLWWKRDRLRWSDVWPLVPLFMLGVAMGLTTAWVEKHHVGAVGAEWALPYAHRYLVAGRAVWFYVGKLLLPWPLIFFYPRWSINPSAWWQHLYPVAAVAVLAALWLWRGRIGKGPLTAVLFFVGTLVPALGFINVYPMRFSFVADHFQYLAGIGIIILAVVVGSRIPLSRKAAGSIAGGILIVLMALTWRQSKVYYDLETLWRDTLTKNPTAWSAMNNLGIVFYDRGQVDEAIALYQQALQLKPDAEVYSNLGLAMKQKGKQDEAIAYYRRALELNPDYPEALNNLGILCRDQGRLDEAIVHYWRAIELRPSYSGALYNLGEALFRQGRHGEAIASYRRALQFDPGYTDAYNNMGVALISTGKADEAIVYLDRAVKLKPDDAELHNNLGNALARTGEVDEAIVHYRRALQIGPNLAEIHRNLALALVEKGKPDEAIAHFRQALQVAPSAGMHTSLGAVLLAQGRVDEAISQYRQALSLSPNDVDILNNLGRALAQNGELDEGISFFRAVVRLEPKEVGAYNNLGNALAIQGRPGEATVYYRQALELRPDDAQACNNLGNVLSVQGRVDEAIEYYRRALRLKPDYLEAHSNLGSALARQGKLDEAIEQYREVVQLQPLAADVHRRLGELLRQRGRTDEAVAEYREVLRLDPQQESTRNMLAALSSMPTSSTAPTR